MHIRDLKKKAKPPKYRAIRTEVDGITFHSKKEAKRYSELKILEKAGKISGLKLQALYPLSCNHELICNYFADFAYFDESGAIIVEDVKGMKTPTYRLKAKLFKANYGQEIKEV